MMARLRAKFDRPVMENALRSMYVEEQVGVLLGTGWNPVGADWAGCDFESASDVRLEVKQSAATQSWSQGQPTRGQFDIRPRMGRYDGATWIDDAGRYAHVYVFAWHGGWGEGVDQRDESQWAYFVVPSTSLPSHQKTIALSSLQKLAIPTDSAHLRAVVGDVADHILVSQP